MEAPRVYQRDLDDLDGVEHDEHDTHDGNSEEMEQQYIYQIPEGEDSFASQEIRLLTVSKRSKARDLLHKHGHRQSHDWNRHILYTVFNSASDE